MAWLLSIHVLLLPVFVMQKTAGSKNAGKASCVLAHTPIAPNIVSTQCFPYLIPNGLCKDFIGSNASLYADSTEQANGQYSMWLFEVGRKAIESYGGFTASKACLQAFYMGSCRSNYPRCDLTSSKPMGQPPCKEGCEFLHKICAKEKEMALAYNKVQGQAGYPIYWNIANCTMYKNRNGGDLPECYYPPELNTETDRLQNRSCYYGNGLGYRGNVSVTQSGHVCQLWSSQCPHRHRHPLAEYPELINASNYCRNPGGQAPSGPWCYTSDRNKRWEYCNVKKCPDPAPTKAPSVVQAISTGSNKILIEWTPVPLPFVHGEPLGFRIHLNKLNDLIIYTTKMHSKQYEVKNLEPLTNYSVQVLEFNKNGDGPLSSALYVQTMPKMRFTAKIKHQQYTSNLQEKNSSRYIFLESTIKSQLNVIFLKVHSEQYNIYRIQIIRFFPGSVGVEFVVTAELINTTSSVVAQSMTGTISENLEAMDLFALNTQAPPPPPANVTHSDVTQTSVAVTWSAPVHSSPFNIANYTIQYKKTDTNMPYYDALVIGASEREAEVDNLDSSTDYMMRVAAVNVHGAQPSEPFIFNTKAVSPVKINLTAIIVPVIVLSVILVAAAVLIYRWWHKKKVEEKRLKETIDQLSANPYASTVDWFDLLQINVIKQWWEIPREDLTLEDELGSGAFGVVRKGFLMKGENEQRRGMYCAVKMLKDSPTERELRDLCNEINLMSKIGDHPNVVSLIGACTINGPPWLVVRFAPNGCLLDYIVENRPLPEYENTVNKPPYKIITERERLKFAAEIAQGMAHLEKHKYVHRDLAARNVLLGKNMVAMVSDFGLSRDVYQEGKYENTAGGVLPVRWMAIESLQDYTYTTRTDVWSYGVLLWEIESGGIVPYSGLCGVEILQQLRNGYRLEKPPNTSRDLYSIMWKCWHPDPKQRPSFSNLAYQVNGLLCCRSGDCEQPVAIIEGHGYDEVKISENEQEPARSDSIELDVM